MTRRTLAITRQRSLDAQGPIPAGIPIKVRISWAASAHSFAGYNMKLARGTLYCILSAASYTLMNICQRELSGNCDPRSLSSCKRW